MKYTAHAKYWVRWRLLLRRCYSIEKGLSIWLAHGNIMYWITFIIYWTFNFLTTSERANHFLKRQVVMIKKKDISWITKINSVWKVRKIIFHCLQRKTGTELEWFRESLLGASKTRKKLNVFGNYGKDNFRINNVINTLKQRGKMLTRESMDSINSYFSDIEKSNP